MHENNLISILRQNRTFLGNTYERIGKWVGFGLFSRKVFLSHDKETGWSIASLNPLQLLFRNAFGLYRNTHLKHVFKCLSEENPQSKVADLSFYSRIAKVWAEKCLKWVGNTSLKDAQVFCFGEKHGDHAYREVVQQFINENYREGDVVLIEGFKAGEVIKACDSQLTQKLKENCLVMGWEPQNFKELNQNGFKLHHAKYQELLELMKQFETTFPENFSFTQSEIPLLKKSLEEIGDKVQELNQYYNSKDWEVLKVKELFSNLLQQVSEQKFKNPRVLIFYAICETLSKLEKEQGKALYKNLTTDAQKHLLKNAPLRDLSLIQEISKNRHDGRRIFVIGGLAHFIQTPYASSKNQVKEELAKHQFVVVGRKKMMDKFSGLNKDIPQLPSP